jgi:hypothetical protein
MRARVAQIAFTLTLIAAAVLAAPDRAHSTAPLTVRPAWTTSAPTAAGQR